MAIEHTFVKKDVESEEYIVKAFEDIWAVPVANRPLSKYESPIISASRVLGDKFYAMNEVNSPDDILTVSTEVNGNFNTETLGFNIETSRELMNYLAAIFNQFAFLCGNFPISKEKAESVKAKLVVLSEKLEAPVSVEISPNDLSRFWDYGPEETIVAVKYNDEIMKYVSIMQRNNQSLQKLGNISETDEAVQKILKENQDLTNKILEIYRGMITDFFGAITRLTNVEPKDMYNISFLFSRELEDGQGNTVKKSDLIMYHHYALSLVENLKGKFGLK